MMQRQLLLPTELVWEIVARIPALHLIRLARFGPTRSAALNFILSTFAKVYDPYTILETRRWTRELIETAKKATEASFHYVNLVGAITRGSPMIAEQRLAERPILFTDEQKLLAEIYEHVTANEHLSVSRSNDKKVVDEWAVGIARTIQNILEKAVVPIRNQLAADGPILQTLELAKDLRKLLDDPVEFSDDLSLMNVSANPPEQPVGPANGQNGNRGNVGAQ